MKQFKSIIILLSFLLFALHANSQKIKIKNDQLLYDKVPIAKASGSGYSFTYTSLDGKQSIDVVSDREGKPADHKEMLTVTNPANGDKRIIPFKALSFSMNRKKMIAELLAKNYDVFLKTGFGNLSKFFAEAEEPVVEAPTAQPKTITSIRETYDTNEDGVVVQADSGIQLATFVGFTTSSDFGKALLDRNGQLIAQFNTSNASGFFEGLALITYDGKFYSTGVSQDNSKSMYQKLIVYLVSAGYEEELKIGMKAYQQGVEQGKYTKKTSANIMDQQGFVADKKGKQYEGKVSLMLEQYLFEREGDRIRSFLDTDRSSKVARLYYEKKKDKWRYKYFSSKSSPKVVVIEQNGALRTFECFKPKKNLADFVSGSSLSLGGFVKNKMVFYEVLKDAKSYYLLYDGATDQLLIKLRSQKHIFTFKELSGKTLLRDFNKYAKSNCAFPAEYEAINFKSPEGLEKLLEYYQSNCN